MGRSLNKSNSIVVNESRRFLLLKRTLDTSICLLMLPFACVIIGIFGILIKLESKGSCIYKQARVGEKGRIFIMYKMRSMYIDSERDGPKWAKLNDTRVTKIGRFIRNTRIDELPQLLNILKGDMSIVGPRPERPYFVSKFKEIIPEYIDRLSVKPGLTGWAQINGGYDLTPKEKFEKDKYYIANQTLLLDIKIILKTVKVVLNHNGAR